MPGQPHPSPHASSSSPPTAPLDPMADPTIRKKVEAARGVAYHLLKGIKTIGLYRHNESRHGEYLQKAWEALTEYLEAYGPLHLQVDLSNFRLHGQDLFAEDSILPYKFFKDGIGQLIFRRGLSLEELITFTSIAVSDPERGADDLNAQLWRAQLPNFEYILVEGFKIDESSEEEIQVEVDQIVSLLHQRLRTNSEDYLRFARVSDEDLDLKFDEIEQLRGVVVQGSPADAGMKARVQKEIYEEEHQRLFPKLITAVFQVVETGIDDADLLKEMFSQLLDAMLLQEDFAIINQVVFKLRAMAQRSGEGSTAERLLNSFLSKMGEEQRLNRVGDILRSTRPKSPQDLTRYLSSMGTDCVSLLIDVLDAVDLPDNRQLLCEVLVPFARQLPQPFVARLENIGRPQLQRDMVFILDRSNHPERLKFFAALLKSKNLALRLDVMAIIAKGRTGEARKLIAAMLHDDNPQVRMQAARVLPEFDRDQACRDLLNVIRDREAFERRDPEEQEALYAAVGATGVAAAANWFAEALRTKSGLFNKQRVLDDKLRAIAGLGGAATIQAAKLLQALAEDQTQPPEIQHQARIQLARVRKQLIGTTQATGGAKET
jgi:hypothetical protein